MTRRHGLQVQRCVCVCVCVWGGITSSDLPPFISTHPTIIMSDPLVVFCTSFHLYPSVPTPISAQIDANFLPSSRLPQHGCIHHLFIRRRLVLLSDSSPRHSGKLVDKTTCTMFAFTQDCRIHQVLFYNHSFQTNWFKAKRPFIHIFFV